MAQCKYGGIIVRIITVRLNSEEEKMYKEYAEFKNVPLSTLLKEALQEKIENEVDLKSILDYEKRLKGNDVEFYSLDETKEILDI